MFSRASLPASSSNADPEANFQDDVEDLYAENLISAQRVARLLDKATKAGIKHIPLKVRKTSGKNQARSITRHKLRRTKWPSYYWFDCRVKEQKTGNEYIAPLCIVLPLEVLESLWELGLPETLLSEENLDTPGRAHMQWMRDALPPTSLDQPLLGWGMHGDGIPCNYDRTESVIMISLNLPGLLGRNGRLRIPLVVLPDHAVSENTFDDIMQVFAWSMRHGLTGTRPVCRHDGSPWASTDVYRRAKTGSCKFRSCLVQIRADWDWMGKCFHFPFHNVKEGCCWLCACKRSQVF
jgi:hypothetical protein